MSSVSMGGGCTAAQYSGLHTSQAGGANRMQKLFGKLDLNGDDAIDQSELQSFVDAIGEKTGAGGIDAKSLLTSLDTDGNGSVSSAELKDNAHTLIDQLRNQLMGSKAEASSSQPDKSFSPPAHAGFGRMLESLLAQYGSSDTGSASQGSTLNVAA